MKEPCFRCKRPTYFNDKMGPLKDGTMFHKGCFKCWICGTRLTLKTYHNNRNDTQDMEIYCAGAFRVYLRVITESFVHTHSKGM